MALNFKSLWAQLSGLTPQEKELIAQFDKDPKATTLVASSDILRKRGYIDEAIVLLEDTVKRFPNYMAARVALGRDYYSRGMFSEAQREIETALMQSVENLMAQRLQLKLALISNDQTKIHTSLEVLRTLTPMDDFTRSAKEYLDMGDYGSARNIVLADLRRLGVTLPDDLVQSGSPTSTKNTPPVSVQSINSSTSPTLMGAGNESISAQGSGWQVPNSSAASPTDAHGNPAIGADAALNFGRSGVSVQPALIDNSGIFSDLPPWINEQLLPQAFTPGSTLAHVRGDLDRYLQLRAFRLISSPEAFSRKRALQQAYSLESTTLADIYASQGHFERAIAIYERLLKDNPSQTSLRAKLDKLQEEARQAAAERYGVQQNTPKQDHPAQAAAQAERERKLKFLEALLKKMDERVESHSQQTPSVQWPHEQTAGSSK